MSNTIQLDDEEREFLASYERDEWQSVRGGKDALMKYQGYATAALEEAGFVSIVLPQVDLGLLRKKAKEQGVSSQTLIADILHLYVSGQLVEKPGGA